MAILTITDPNEIAAKRRGIEACRSTDDISVWRQSIRENGGERFEGESALLVAAELRIRGGK